MKLQEATVMQLKNALVRKAHEEEIVVEKAPTMWALNISLRTDNVFDPDEKAVLAVSHDKDRLEDLFVGCEQAKNKIEVLGLIDDIQDLPISAQIVHLKAFLSAFLKGLDTDKIARYVVFQNFSLSRVQFFVEKITWL